MLHDLFEGAASLLRGFGLIQRPGLRRYVAIPLAVNTVLFAGGGWLLAVWFADWLERTVSGWPDWLAWLEWLAWPLFILVFLVFGLYTFTLIAHLLAAPFNGVLARRVGRHLGWEPPSGGGHLITGVLGDLGLELWRIARFLGWSLAILLLFLVPGLGLLAPALWLIMSAWMLAEEYADPALESHGLEAGERRRAMREHRWYWLGFGTAALGATLVPILNFAVMPAGVAGAMALCTRHPSAAA